MTPLLKVEGLVKTFGGRRALDGVSLAVLPGEVVGLVGPNGSGKSTLIATICGIQQPNAGSIRLAGTDLLYLSAPARARHGICKTYQQPRCFESLSAVDNLLVAQHGVRVTPEAVERALALLESVGLDSHRDVAAGLLSGGQRKLLDFARAMMTGPRLLLLDEPTAGLHPNLIGVFMRRLLEFVSRGCGVLIASHDLDSISSTCHRLVGMHNGKVIADGPPKEVLRSDQLIEAYIGY